jgi:hypothetical protein
MTRTTTLAVLAVFVGSTACPLPAAAKLPPHQPGTVCATATFWCWAPHPGAPGAHCACQSPQGQVPGTLV